MTLEEHEAKEREMRQKFAAERAEDVQRAFKRALELIGQAKGLVEFDPTSLLLGLVDRLLEEQGSLIGANSNLTATGAQMHGQGGNHTYFASAGSSFNPLPR
jgi:hypothetical protein